MDTDQAYQLYDPVLYIALGYSACEKDEKCPRKQTTLMIFTLWFLQMRGEPRGAQILCLQQELNNYDDDPLVFGRE